MKYSLQNNVAIIIYFSGFSDLAVVQTFSCLCVSYHFHNVQEHYETGINIILLKNIKLLNSLMLLLHNKMQRTDFNFSTIHQFKD